MLVELLIAGEFHKTIEIEADSEEEALSIFWNGEEPYESTSEWEFSDMTYAEVHSVIDDDIDDMSQGDDEGAGYAERLRAELDEWAKKHDCPGSIAA